MKNKLLIITFILTTQATICAPFDYKTTKGGFKYVVHSHNEASFQHAHCSNIGGIEEYKLPDTTRVDCFTDTYVIEYDFADKKYESVGQALHYAVMTGKKPKIVLILDKSHEKAQMHYVNRLRQIGNTYNFEVEYVTEDILNLDKNN